MSTPPESLVSASSSASAYQLVPASHYDVGQLAEIYNATRVDYIVPMPMNAKRMGDYIRTYDIDLNASLVCRLNTDTGVGIAMLGVRNSRAWLTRLGVIPEQREHKFGRIMVDELIQRAQQMRCREMQLEVIVGNEPAYRLFRKLGFEDQRDLLVVRRPPGKIELPLPALTVEPLSAEGINAILAARPERGSWIDENASLVNSGTLEGISLHLPDGSRGAALWVRGPFQISHILLHTPEGDPQQMAYALLHTLHTRGPMMDTKLENLPLHSPFWPVFQQFGYHETFRRIEMSLALS